MLQAVAVDLHTGGFGVLAGSGAFHAPLIDIGSKNFQRRPGAGALKRFHEKDPQGIGFLPSGGAGHPRPNHFPTFFVRHDVGDDDFGQQVKSLGISEETRNCDQHLLPQCQSFGTVVEQQSVVSVEVRDVPHLHPSIDPAQNGRRLVVPEVDPTHFEQQGQDRFERLIRRQVRHGHRHIADLGGRSKRLVAHVRHDAAGQILRRQHSIHHTGADRASGHAVELRRFRLLNTHKAIGGIDRHRAPCAIGAGAREHHANRLRSIRLSQGREKDVDRQGESVRALWGQVQMPLTGVHDRTRRYQIDVARFDAHVILNHHHRHAGVAGQKVVHDRFVVWRQVLDHHESRTAIRWTRVEETLQSVKPAR